MLRIADWLLITEVSGQHTSRIIKGQSLEMGPLGCPKTSVTAHLRCVTAQKNKDLIYTAAGA
jgi:hypothetical protein